MKLVIRLVLFFVLHLSYAFSQVPSYVPTDSLIGWWPFNGNANDESGNGLDGIINGPLLTTDRFGKQNSAYEFYGINDNILIDTAFFNNGWESYTFSCWMNLKELTNPKNNYNSHVLLNTSPHNGLGLGYNWGNSSSVSFSVGNGTPAYNWNTNLFDAKGLSTIQKETWKMVTIVKSNRTYTLYVDGIKDIIYECNQDISSHFYKIVLGSCDQDACNEVLDGKLDDVGIWNRSLSQQEIFSLYDNQSSYLASITIVSNVPCFNGVNGSATVAVIGGIGPYTYAWNTTPVQTTQTASNLCAGTYTVTVKDSRDSIATASITITQPPAITNVIASITKNLDCFGASSGSASVSNPTGGTPPYSYSWNTIPAQQTQIATNMKAGDYTVTVTDSKGCIAQAAVTITQPDSPVEIGQASVEQHVSCHGLSDGIINISAPFGGTPPYTIVWNTQPVRYGERLEGVEAGAYTAVVIDSKGCISETTTTVTEPEKIRILSPKDTIVLIQSNAMFYAKSNNEGTTYQWQTNLGIGFQDIQEIYQYTGTKTPILNIANCSFYNHNQPFRCILKTNGCYDTTEIATLSIRTNVSVEDVSNNTRLSISPNPTGESDQFLVRFTETPNQDISIELLDILGSIHYSNTIQAGSESCTIPVQGLSSGMYMLRVRMNNEVFIEKVIVN
jgi:hypothetical protein